MDSLQHVPPSDESPHTTDAPDELSPSMAVFLAEIYATPDDLTEDELQDLAVAEDERVLSQDIHDAIRANRQLSDVLAEMGLPVRVAV